LDWKQDDASRIASHHGCAVGGVFLVLAVEVPINQKGRDFRLAIPKWHGNPRGTRERKMLGFVGGRRRALSSNPKQEKVTNNKALQGGELEKR
jgi:hypothetical protein